MRRTVPALVFFCLLTLGFAAAQDESLGDAARQARMRKTSPAATEKVYTNDNLPTSGGIGIAALTPNPLNSASSSTASTQAATDTSANAADKKLKATSPEDSPEARQQLRTLIDQMRSLDPSRFPGNPALVEQMRQQLTSGVDALELQLRRQLEESRGGTIRNADPARVPAGYRDSVAEYYRKLSGAGN